MQRALILQDGALITAADLRFEGCVPAAAMADPVIPPPTDGKRSGGVLTASCANASGACCSTRCARYPAAARRRRSGSASASVPCATSWPGSAATASASRCESGPKRACKRRGEEEMSEIGSAQLLSQLRSMASAAGAGQAPLPEGVDQVRFSELLMQAVDHVNGSQQTVSQMREEFQLGGASIWRKSWWPRRNRVSNSRCCCRCATSSSMRTRKS